MSNTLAYAVVFWISRAELAFRRSCLNTVAIWILSKYLSLWRSEVGDGGQATSTAVGASDSDQRRRAVAAACCRGEPSVSGRLWRAVGPAGMSARRSRVATGVLVALFVTTGCDATPHRQPGDLSITGGDLSSIVARAVQQELRPIVGRLESQVESLDSRLTLLDSRVSDLTAHVLRGGQGHQMDELSSRLDSLDSRLSKVIVQTNNRKSEQEKVAATVDNHVALLYTVVTRLENHETKLAQLSARLNDQQSEQQSRQGDITFTPAKDRAIHRTPTQQTVAGTTNNVRDCSDLPAVSPSGIYSILPNSDSRPVQAYCDMDSAGGGWTVIQRRDDIQPRQDFYLGWAEYRRGFGNLTGEFWWGLENMHQLTSSNETQYELRVELETFNGDQAFAVYRGFRVSSEDDGYRLTASYVTGGAGDGLLWSVNMKFTTKDRDHDQSSGSPGNCAQIFKGAFWYSNCASSSLNGPYHSERAARATNGHGIWWRTWRAQESHKKAQMKIRSRQR